MGSATSLPLWSSIFTVGTINTRCAAANALLVVLLPSKSVSGVWAPTVTSRISTWLRYVRSLLMGIR